MSAFTLAAKPFAGATAALRPTAPRARLARAPVRAAADTRDEEVRRVPSRPDPTRSSPLPFPPPRSPP